MAETAVAVRNPLSTEPPTTFDIKVDVPAKINRGTEGTSLKIYSIKVGDLVVFPTIDAAQIAAALRMKEETVGTTVPIADINELIVGFNEVSLGGFGGVGVFLRSPHLQENATQVLLCSIFSLCAPPIGYARHITP